MNHSIIVTALMTTFFSPLNASEIKSAKNELLISIEKGAIEISNTSTRIKMTPEIVELVKQISRSKLNFSKPILIFSNDEIFLNDSEKLDEVLAVLNDTIVSV